MNQELFAGFVGQEAPSAMNRRDFLKSAGTGIYLFFRIGDLSFITQEGTGRPQAPSLPTDFNAYLRIAEDGSVSCYTGKIEMGQGVFTSLAQELADEMDVALDAVTVVMGDTDLCPYDMGTWGSMSTRGFGPGLRRAGAEARQVLLEMASEHLKKPVENLATEDGSVFLRTDKSVRVSYADLAKGKKIERHPAGTVTLKKPSEFRIMSKPTVRKDGKEKVTGKAKFAADIRVPGMMYAKILRPPAHGAKLLEVDTSEAEKMSGVQIVRDGDLVAVLHAYPDVAQMALEKVKAKFDVPKAEVDDRTIYDHLLKVAPAPRVAVEGGDLSRGESQAASVFNQTYLNAYVAHSPIEPHAATARIDGGKATVWASTQSPFGSREEVARALGLSPQNVRVITPYVGGGFGGKGRNPQVIEAARLAKLSGKPVQVAWTRKEEFFYDSFRPAAVVKIRSGITSGGMISFWDYHVYYAGERGAQQFYTIPNHRTSVYNSGWAGAEGAHPFATGAWRAPGNNTNTFARESQIDLMASKAGADPVEFRLKHLSDPKMKRVLQTAAEKFPWKSAASPSGRGLGVALGIDAGTYVAAIAEVAVDRHSGAVQVKRVLAVQDMGLVINPEGAAMQMEGCITMGLGYTLKEQVHFRGGEITDLNYDSYDIPRFSWLPRIETHIVDDQNSDAQGGGEPAIVAMGAVVANAIYDATGARLLELPMTPERVAEALKKG
ncbi:MAG TPA: molybdopterin cofactor-binding domain-containing protein [Bacteroidota bacterium]|nr:molybdopterin cofactor-binding domain-containing protein [Bacteroidota bacterium]